MTAPRVVAAEFDSWAEAGRGESMADGHGDMTAQALDRVDFDSDDRALDLGCGIGWGAREMLARGCGWAAGVDLSAAMLARAPAGAGAGYAVSRAEALPFVGGTFTRVLTVEALYYCLDLPAALRELRRVCADGARVVCLLDLYADNPGAHGWVDALDVDVHLLSAAQWAEAFRNAGFAGAETDAIVDRRPLTSAEEFEPSRWFADYASYRGYRELGGLLIDAVA